MIKKLKSKKIIIVSIMILLTCCLMLSYATFVVTTSDYKASELLVSELTYSLAIYEEGSTTPISGNIIISGNQTKIYNLEIRSINKIDSKYSLAYNSQDDLTVKYSNRTSWSTEDYIKDYNSNNIKKVRIVVENKSNEERNVEIKIFGGYRYNDYIKIDTKGYTRITEEYDEELLASSELLNEIVHEETKCESERCLYGGGSKSNYLSYSNNLYRIIGTYNINNERVTKIISENITPTTNIKEDLNNIYNSLENKNDIIYKTNKFNCNETACTETEYENIGLLTKYEYDLIGGENSYLKNNEGYYILNGTTVETQNGSELGSLKPVIYLPERTRVTGSGTLKDPYKIKTSDINILAYTYNGEETDIPYETLKNEKIVDKIECEKGSTASWDYETSSIKITNPQIPEYCTVNFVDGYNVTLNVINGKVINGTNTVKIRPGENATFNIDLGAALPNTNLFSMECDKGAEITENNGVVTVSNINVSQTCTVKYHISIRITGNTENNDSDACYLIKNNSTTLTYNGIKYTNCTVAHEHDLIIENTYSHCEDKKKDVSIDDIKYDDLYEVWTNKNNSAVACHDVICVTYIYCK